MENLETFLKNEEKTYKQRVTEKSKIGCDCQEIEQQYLTIDRPYWN